MGGGGNGKKQTAYDAACLEIAICHGSLLRGGTGDSESNVACSGHDDVQDSGDDANKSRKIFSMHCMLEVTVHQHPLTFPSQVPSLDLEILLYCTGYLGISHLPPLVHRCLSWDGFEHVVRVMQQIHYITEAPDAFL